MADDESFSAERIKHLEFIQAIVTRFSTNSFLIKGWAITVVTAVLAFELSKASSQIAGASILPVIAFWLLDSYFLRQERLFRHLYNDVRRKDSSVEPFSMDISSYVKKETLTGVATSVTMIAFYLPIFLITAVVLIVDVVRHT